MNGARKQLKTGRTRYMSMSLLIKNLNQNPIFKYVSSVRLAVPLMLILGVLVAYGTIIESNYNSEYASMVIYKSNWFGLLIILLWINIFSATISRIPFKIHHTGFVITHIGLLTLLIGGYITNTQGIDGQLIIPENQSSSTVVLPHLMVGYQFDGSPTPQIIKFQKTISEQNQNDLNGINGLIGHLFSVKKYIPFAKVESSFTESTNPNDQSVALSFILKSNFFNVTEWLHSEKKSEMKMGPALLRLVKIDDINRPLGPTGPTPTKNKKRVINSESQTTNPPKPPAKKSEGDYLVITSATGGEVVKKIKLDSLLRQKQTFNGFDIQIVNYFKHAIVSENKMIESDDPTHNNPALELSISKGPEKFREVLYAKYSGFSLNQKGVFGYKFALEINDPEIVPQASSPHGSSAPEVAQPSADSSMATRAQAAMGGDNTVIFAIDPKEKTKARVTLIKNKEIVMSEILTEGQSLQTPWMGMTIFLGSIKINAIEQMTALPINPEKSQQLPPSAILIKPNSSNAEQNNNEFWLAEGEQKQTTINGKNAVVYFGRQTIELPFELRLEKFSKVDYPGTSTPMSFESKVQIGSTGISQVISMNEPLKMDGFTVYQASYSITPEQTLSIFSVNRDPGRFLKYLGSLILGLGIITITLMRSRVWKNYLQRKTQHA